MVSKAHLSIGIEFFTGFSVLSTQVAPNRYEIL